MSRMTHVPTCSTLYKFKSYLSTPKVEGCKFLLRTSWRDMFIYHAFPIYQYFSKECANQFTYPPYLTSYNWITFQSYSSSTEKSGSSVFCNELTEVESESECLWRPLLLAAHLVVYSAKPDLGDGAFISSSPLNDSISFTKFSRDSSSATPFRFFISTICSLNEACSPSTPLVRIEPEFVPQLFPMQPPKLCCHKLQVLWNKCEWLYFGKCFHCSSGGW